MSDLVTIATFAVPWEAHILRGRLEAEGIPAFVVDENITNTTQLWQIRLQVRTRDAERAFEIKRQSE